MFPEMKGIPVSNSVLTGALAFLGANGSPEIFRALTPVVDAGFCGAAAPKTIGLAAAVAYLCEHCYSPSNRAMTTMLVDENSYSL